MLKKDFDKIKKCAKKQQALQQSMLDVAIENSQATIVSEVPNNGPFSNPLIIGTALAIFLVLIML